jgi:signal transduction histidine kinase/CheY-like chemotaxis protein
MSTVNLDQRTEHAAWPKLTPSRTAILGLAAYVLLYVSWQLLGWIPGSRQDVGDLLIVPVDAAAVCAAWWASRRCAQVERLRSFWRLMAIALAAEMIGDIVQAIYEVGFHASPYPSLADPFYLAFYALLLLALLRVPVAPVTRGKLARTMLDGATIVVGGGAVVWYFVLGPTAVQGGESALAMGVSLAFPVGDLFLLAGLAAVLLRQSPVALRTPLALITAAVALGIVADVFYGYGQLHETFTAGDWIDTIYVLEFTTFALAGLSQRPVSRGEPSVTVDASGRHRSRASWLPYLSLAIGLGVLLGVERGNRFFPDVSLVLIVIVLAVLVAARQYLAQRELVQTEVALRESERVKDEFISVVGHELRTPLTSIRGSLGLLQGGVFGELPEEAQSMVALAVTNTDRLVRLINDILDFERMDAGRVELELAPVKASGLLEGAIQIVQMTATQARVTLLQDIQDDLTVSVDADRIVQVLVNLIGNAIKFSPRSSTITITVASEHGRALFSVADTGRGIPADRLESIFERFRQVDSSDAREKGGSGLGLAIARNIVEHHGGAMSVESEIGQGSTFYFTLPLVEGRVTMLVCGSENGDASTDGGRLAELRAIAPAFGSGTVLVVEDDPSLGEVLTETLGHKEIATRLVRTAQDAVKEIRRSQPSVLLLDLMLPGKDGFTVIERLRGDGLLRDTHLLVYTALDLNQGDRERLQLGHTEFLSKATVTPQDIEQRVSELLHGQKAGTT